MASGTIDGTPQADDVNFATQPEPVVHADAGARLHRPEPALRRRGGQPAGASPAGRDAQLPGAQGLRRVLRLRAREHGERASRPSHAGDDPARGGDHVARLVRADRSRPGRRSTCAARSTRAATAYTCTRLRRARLRAQQRLTPTSPPATSSRSRPVRVRRLDAHSARSTATLARARHRRTLKALLPGRRRQLHGREPGPARRNFNGRPNTEPYGFTVQGRRRRAAAGETLTGEDRRNLYLHRDQDMLPGLPEAAARATASPRPCSPTSTATTATS